MLIGISVTSVTSKRSCALDDSPSVKESETNGKQARENRFETLDSVDSALCDLRRSRVIGDSFPEFGHIDSWK